MNYDEVLRKNILLSYLYFLTHLVELKKSLLYLQNIDVQLIWMIIQKYLNTHM